MITDKRIARIAYFYKYWAKQTGTEVMSEAKRQLVRIITQKK